MKFRTLRDALKWLAVLALVALPLLFLVGCAPPAPARQSLPAPLPVTPAHPVAAEVRRWTPPPAARSASADRSQLSTFNFQLSASSPVGLFALSSPLRVATEKGHQSRDGVTS